MSDGESNAGLINTTCRKAFYAERDSDLVEALRLYRLAFGLFSLVSETEKDGIRLTFGRLEAKIEDLKKQVFVTQGHGNVKRIPIEYRRPSSFGDY